MAKQDVTRKKVTWVTECPVCKVGPRERCIGVNKFKDSIHTERWGLYFARHGRVGGSERSERVREALPCP